MLASGLQSSVVDLLVSNADVLFPDGRQSSLLIAFFRNFSHSIQCTLLEHLNIGCREFSVYSAAKVLSTDL